jgi:hypothetical protein
MKLSCFAQNRFRFPLHIDRQLTSTGEERDAATAARSTAMTDFNTPEETPKSSKFNKKWLAALAVPVAGVGVAGAQTADETPADKGPTDTDTDSTVEGERAGRRGHRAGAAIAEALGLEGSELRELVQGGQTIAEVAADQGVDIDSVIADMVAEAETRAAENGKEDFDPAALTERLTAVVNGEAELGRRGHRGGPRGGAASEAVQELLGLDGDAIKAAIQEGSTLADVAADQGVSTEDLVSTIVDDIEERMAASDRDLPEDFDIEALTERVTDRVNGEGPERPERGERPEGRRGPGGAPDADAAVANTGVTNNAGTV